VKEGKWLGGEGVGPSHSRRRDLIPRTGMRSLRSRLQLRFSGEVLRSGHTTLYSGQAMGTVSPGDSRSGGSRLECMIQAG
jgi:hypothetical protein